MAAWRLARGNTWLPSWRCRQRRLGVSAATLFQLAGNLSFQLLADLVPHEADDDDDHQQRREDADREANAEQRVHGLRGVRAVAVARQQPSRHRATETQTSLEREQNGGE